jgi:hypothetical protein
MNAAREASGIKLNMAHKSAAAILQYARVI